MSENSVGEDRIAGFIVWEWMLPEKHRKGFRDALFAFENNILKESSEYWRDQVEAAYSQSNKKFPEIISQLCDCLESLLAADAICIRDADDSEEAVLAKIGSIEQTMNAVIRNPNASDREKNIARKILGIAYEHIML